MQSGLKVYKELNKDEAFELDQEIKELRGGTIMDFWRMVHKLGFQREGRGWTVLGYDTWASYLAQPEIDYAEHTVENLLNAYVTIYKHIINSPEKGTFDIVRLDPMLLKFDSSRAKLIAPRLTLENTNELISKAESLSYKDFEAEMMDEKDKVSDSPSWLRLFNIWSFGKQDPRWGHKHPGQIPGQIMANLLHYYTQEGDLVVDPFGGGGSSLDVCRDFNRKCWIGDLSPTRADIESWDITKGFPSKAKGAQLVFLDPPYAMVNKGKYTAQPTDLSNLGLKNFYNELDKILISAKGILKEGGYIALIIGGTLDIAGGEDFAINCYKLLARYYKEERRVIVPYTTQNYRPDQVIKAKEGKYMLNLFRDLMIFKYGH